MQINFFPCVQNIYIHNKSPYLSDKLQIMNCIICDTSNQALSIEHIVSESFGNKKYTTQRSVVCDSCNARLSRAERKALSHTIFVMERARLGIAAKSGKAAKGSIGVLDIEGSPDFKKNEVGIKGLQRDDFINHNPQKNTYEIIVPSFDKVKTAPQSCF